MQLQFEIFFLLFVSFSNVFGFLLFSEIVFHFNLYAGICIQFYPSVQVAAKSLIKLYFCCYTLSESETDHL